MAITTFQSPIDLQLPQLPLTRDGELYKELVVVYNAVRTLQQGITLLTGAVQADPATWNLQQASETLLLGNLNRFYCQAGENIGYGQFVKFVNNGIGGVAAVLASATGTTAPAEGYCSTTGGLLVNEFGEFIMRRGLLQNLTGLTPGQRYWLSLTDGNITNVKPSAAAQLGQYIGTAISDSQLVVDIGPALAAASGQF